MDKIIEPNNVSKSGHDGDNSVTHKCVSALNASENSEAVKALMGLTWRPADSLPQVIIEKTMLKVIK